jgi:hypothetical protein
MMSFDELDRQALGPIEDGLAGSDPGLASKLNIFSRLVAGEEMLVHEKIQARRGWPGARRPRRVRQHPRRGTALRPPHRPYRRSRWPQAMLLVWVVISAGLLTLALVLNTSGRHVSCNRSAGTQCLALRSGSIPTGPT